MRNIVVAVDLGEQAADLVAIARDLACALRAKLWIVHVIAPDPEFVGLAIGPQSVRDDRARELTEEHRELRDIVVNLRNDGIPAEGRFHRGETVATILDVCRDVEADLIIVGKHNRGKVARAILGSVCESLVQRCVCPVMVIPAHGSGVTWGKGRTSGAN